MSLDFRNTCPEIDDAILDYKYHTEDFLKNLISQFIPSELLNERDYKYSTFIQDSLSEINSQILPLFEGLRKLNSEMRDEADEQIYYLQRKLEEAEEQVTDYQNKLEELGWE